jgi:rhodanese-related sulfurtransferase
MKFLMCIQLILNQPQADVSTNVNIRNMKDNQLLNGSFIFFALIIAGLVFSAYVKFDKGYKLNNYDLLISLEDDTYLISNYDFLKIYREDASNYLFVDLRSEEEFKLSGLENTVNIPIDDVFEKSSLKKLKKTKEKIVLCSNSESDASLIYLMLRSLGYDNIFVLGGSLDIFIEEVLNNNNPAYYFYSEEKKKWNYKNYIRTKVQERIEPEPKPEQLKIQGGC